MYVKNSATHYIKSPKPLNSKSRPWLLKIFYLTKWSSPKKLTSSNPLSKIMASISSSNSTPSSNLSNSRNSRWNKLKKTTRRMKTMRTIFYKLLSTATTKLKIPSISLSARRKCLKISKSTLRILFGFRSSRSLSIMNSSKK